MPPERHLPSDLAAKIVGSNSLPADGMLEKRRLYLHGYHPKAACFGENLRVVPENETLTHEIETTIDLTDYPPDYYLG